MIKYVTQIQNRNFISGQNFQQIKTFSLEENSVSLTPYFILLLTIKHFNSVLIQNYILLDYSLGH